MVMARKAEMRSKLVSPEHKREHASPEIEVQKTASESHPANHRRLESMCRSTFILFHAPVPVDYSRVFPQKRADFF
jgi:hypothetical protein